MHKLSEELFQNAMDMSDTIVFRYDYNSDSISFSQNVEKFIPVALVLNAFTTDIEIIGKVFPDDTEKALSFFTIRPDTDKVKMEYIRFMDHKGDYLWYQLKGRLDEKRGKDVLYGTITYVDDEHKNFLKLF